ncbi:hypothetical protein Pint_15112 [Pistacia integerrima]|uniref:Uncharacterized protein n=1 Tax=Pistacia integerrima TaxID=434235 RepID=A0ACC0Z9E4_9ROSI|nr:hypothetical protein Pint_15112 [Pistacia integerrima]
MRGTAALLLAKYKLRLKQIYPITGSWDRVGTITPKKLVNNDSTVGGLIRKENAEPIAAFSKPPPIPPIIGPLVALSLLETWWSSDDDDD